MTTEMAPLGVKDVGDSLVTQSLVSERWASGSDLRIVEMALETNFNFGLQFEQRSG